MINIIALAGDMQIRYEELPVGCNSRVWSDTDMITKPLKELAGARIGQTDTFPASDTLCSTPGAQDLERTLDDLRLEHDRIALLIHRDGLPATMQWVWRTLRSYRRAVLDKHGFARLPLYRRCFIQSYCDFKCWLERVEAHRHATPRTS